jgi:predicted RNase H-like HicB family nuclease
MNYGFFIEFEQKTDGRWIAEIVELPGVMAYGETKMQAGEKAEAIALRAREESSHASYNYRPQGQNGQGHHCRRLCG